MCACGGRRNMGMDDWSQGKAIRMRERGPPGSPQQEGLAMTQAYTHTQRVPSKNPPPVALPTFAPPCGPQNTVERHRGIAAQRFPSGP
mmetsp:Transcript_111042/g.192548  ORF Transcript_111042/g.192548 Transcript_111042/m.192548 type:complete len:88 (+) Transcript_111042:188-451(+)